MVSSCMLDLSGSRQGTVVGSGALNNPQVSTSERISLHSQKLSPALS